MIVPEFIEVAYEKMKYTLTLYFGSEWVAPPTGAKGMHPKGACCPIPNADYLYPDFPILLNRI
jgi:hypothetical protein